MYGGHKPKNRRGSNDYAGDKQTRNNRETARQCRDVSERVHGGPRSDDISPGAGRIVSRLILALHDTAVHAM